MEGCNYGILDLIFPIAMRSPLIYNILVNKTQQF